MTSLLSRAMTCVTGTPCSASSKAIEARFTKSRSSEGAFEGALTEIECSLTGVVNATVMSNCSSVSDLNSPPP